MKEYKSYWNWPQSILQFDIFTVVLYIILCVPERTGTGESAAISKNVSAVFTILFLIWYIYCLCKKILWINQKVLKMWLWTWTQINLGIKNFCWMPLISQNSSRWKILSIMSYTKPWNAIGMESDQWWWMCHFHTYSNHITILIVLKIY